jgi:putative salt-induced outer membrane protein YdiY
MCEMRFRIRDLRFYISLFLTFFAVATPCPAKVKRHDLIIMKNGDRLTGEVKRLEQGVLYIQTDYFSGSVGVDWLQVEKVVSEANFQVTLNDGKRLAGKITKVESTEAAGGDFKVLGSGVNATLPGTDVVQIEPQKQNFWRQLKGSIDFGYNFTSGNNQSSLSTSASAIYIAPHWAAGSSYTASVNGQTGGSTTNLFEVQGFGERFLNRNSLILGLSDFLKSSQQDLVLRTTLGGGYGRYLARNNKNELRWLFGADYSRANYQASLGQPVQQNVELLVGVQYQLFYFDRYTLQSQVLVFPGMSDFGRVRLTTNNTFGIKLTNNFHLNFSFWDNFDSSPPQTARKNATGLSTTLGWSF